MLNIEDSKERGEFIAETSRVEAFSDAIIAIIMTILVLEIRIPELHGQTVTENLLILKPLWPKFAAFLVSFLALAVIWVNHHHFFHALKGIDKALLWHNNHLLVWVCLVPFVTGLAGENLADPTATFVYGFAMFMMSIAFSAMIRHAFFHSNILPETVTKQERVKQFRRSLFGPVAYAVAAVCSFFIPWFSIGVYLLVMVFYFLPQRIEDAMSEAMGA